MPYCHQRLQYRPSEFSQGAFELNKIAKLAGVVLALLLAASAAAAQTDAQTPEEICAAAVPAADPATREFSQAEQVLQAGVDYRAVFCTGAGPVYIDLLETDTPITVNNFVFLAQNGYYNNINFHRVIANFMAQGGDPTNLGTGGPNYRFEDEFVPSLRFDAPGKLAMANAGPGTNGSQFFITTAPTPHLNDLHTIFGTVIAGQANVVAIEIRDPGTAATPGTTLDTVVIITDPTTVTLPETTPLEQADVVTAFNEVSTIITPDIAEVLENIQTVQETADVIAAVPEAAREALTTLLETNNHQYRITSTINNKACDLQNVQFISATYALDAFGSSEDAAAALSDPAMAQIPLDSGFTTANTSENLAYPYFTTTVTACDQEVTRAMTYFQRGSFIATAEILVPAGTQDLDRVLTEFVAQRIFEPFLANVLFWGIQ
ncbi:MAG: peptidylprolyl isomerase [Anaerolineae bacterium]|nr:peptidylprolyl isomerase [Anaerolineae bacterium]